MDFLFVIQTGFNFTFEEQDQFCAESIFRNVRFGLGLGLQPIFGECELPNQLGNSPFFDSRIIQQGGECLSSYVIFLRGTMLLQVYRNRAYCAWVQCC